MAQRIRARGLRGPVTALIEGPDAAADRPTRELLEAARLLVKVQPSDIQGCTDADRRHAGAGSPDGHRPVLCVAAPGLSPAPEETPLGPRASEEQRYPDTSSK